VGNRRVPEHGVVKRKHCRKLPRDQARVGVSSSELGHIESRQPHRRAVQRCFANEMVREIRQKDERRRKGVAVRLFLEPIAPRMKLRTDSRPYWAGVISALWFLIARNRNILLVDRPRLPRGIFARGTNRASDSATRGEQPIRMKYSLGAR
jgi:hypothetical protein